MLQLVSYIYFSKYIYNKYISGLPDTIIFLSTLSSTLERHPGIVEAAKMTIPTIGICDSNSEPNYVTYPVPGNDDSTPSIRYYMKLFQLAIERGREAREKAVNQK